jgi:glucose/mannose-6-phosphate isomerase
MQQVNTGFETMWGYVGALGAQLAESWAAGASGVAASQLRSVVVCGMGGSAAAAELVSGILDPGLMQLRVQREYGFDQVPGDGTLLVFSSYSGNTEETLSAWAAAESRAPGLPRVVVCSGGRLGELADAAAVPRVPLPGGLPPRASLGHGIGALCAVLERVGDPGLAEQVPPAIATLEAGNRRWGLGAEPATDSALIPLARELNGRWPVIYSGCRLTHAVSRRLRAQINENAKLLVSTAELPELDHNEVVGWGQPTAAREQARVLALRDESESPRVALRFAATRESLGLDGSRWFERRSLAGPPLARMLGLVQEGDVLSCLLAREAGVDPMPVDVIDRLKDRLARD